MRFVWATALKDVARMLRDPAALLLWLAIPILIGLLLFLAFGGRGSRNFQASLLVADHDKSTVSGMLVAALDRVPVIAADSAGEARGRAQVEAGRASALLVIPRGFGDAALEGRPMALPLVTNPAQRLGPRIIEEALDALLDAAFYAQRLFREPIAGLRPYLASGSTVPPDEAIARASIALNRAVGRLLPYYSPPIATLETQRVAAAPEPGFGALFLPGLLFMTLLFVGEGLSSDLWRERSQGTLRRALATPRSARAFLAGKVVAGVILIAAICAIALPLQAALFGLAPPRLPLAFAWSLFAGTVFLTVLALLQLLASSQRTAGILTSLVLYPLLMVGGSFFPFEAMPEWLARIGRATPNGWALSQLKAIMAGSATFAGLIVPLAGLSAVGVACFLLGARRLTRGFAA